MKRILLFIVISLFLSSCETFYMSVSSLKEQFAGIDSSKMKMVDAYDTRFQMPNITYWANPIKIIYCKDANGNPGLCINSPNALSIFTYGKSSARIVFYFDRITIHDGRVYGVESRLFPFIKSSIPIDSITKIEVRQGANKYKYITPPWPK